jgi:hypothetical protein
MDRSVVRRLSVSGCEAPATHDRIRTLLRVTTTVAAVLLLPPFLLLAVLPMLLFMLPVAIVGIPFIIPALLSVSVAARSEELRYRESWKPKPIVPAQRAWR